MAIYSLHHSSVGRTTHAPGTAGAHIAYITRKRAAAVVLSARMPVAAPGNAAEARAWLDGEEAAGRKNERVADKLMLALPIELDPERQETLVRDFAEEATVGRAPWIGALHLDRRNPHAHLLIRDKDPATGKRVALLSEKGSTERLRAAWERHANAALAAAGSCARIDRRSLAAQGVEREAEIHVGPQPKAMEARGLRPISRDRRDRRGREIRWTDVDEGRTRSDRRAEIIATNAAAAEERRWATLAAAWDICAEQIATDLAERAETDRWRALAAAWPVTQADTLLEPEPANRWEVWARRIEAEQAAATVGEQARLSADKGRLAALGARLHAAFTRRVDEERLLLADRRRRLSGLVERLPTAMAAVLGLYRQPVKQTPQRPLPGFLKRAAEAAPPVAVERLSIDRPQVSRERIPPIFQRSPGREAALGGGGRAGPSRAAIEQAAIEFTQRTSRWDRDHLAVEVASAIALIRSRGRER